MTDTIRIENIGKRYVISHARKYDSLQGALFGAMKDFASRFRCRGAAVPLLCGEGQTEFWALRDVTFNVPQGACLGLIGRNGAGKSTLLKILSRVVAPTEGEVAIRGRVASLLEVGTGFHPEFTGRENIFMSGTVLGMSRPEILKQFDSIVDFSGIENFLDTPVKRYSSGMYVRLAFAVASHLESEILLVDEVLAVGDAEFQKKCLGRMDGISKSGRTVIFVSHNLAMIGSLCNDAVLLHQGNMVFRGSPSDAILQYLTGKGGNPAHFICPDDRYIGDDLAQLLEAWVAHPDGAISNDVHIVEPTTVSVKFRMQKDTDRAMVPTLYFYRGDGSVAFSVHHPARRFARGEHRVRCHIPGNFLNDGSYSVTVCLLSFEPYSLNCFQEESLLTFTVTDPLDGTPTRSGYPRPIQGAVRPLLRWTHEGD